ncbi:MAG: hypothetical protein LBS99_07995, partial [Clostridiales bacterium]|nr:hypothetical protein [Clostridiales bacterium]
ELFGDDFLPIFIDMSSPLSYRQGLRPYGAGLEPSLYNGVSPTDILSATRAAFMPSWANIIGEAK